MTTYIQPRQFMPVYWKQTNFVSGQGSAVSMEIPGFPSGMVDIALTREASIVSVGFMLSAALTAGFIRVQLTRNGAAVGPTRDITSSDGVKGIWEIAPGKLVGSMGNALGIQWGSNAAMAPSGSIDGVFFIEVQAT